VCGLNDKSKLQIMITSSIPPNQLCGLTDGTKLQIIIMSSKLLNLKRNAAFKQSKTWQPVHERLQILSHITPWVTILKNLKRSEQRLPNRNFMWKLLKFVLTQKYIRVHSEYRELTRLKRLGTSAQDDKQHPVHLDFHLRTVPLSHSVTTQ
jgi:hypothetical protein